MKFGRCGYVLTGLMVGLFSVLHRGGRKESGGAKPGGGEDDAQVGACRIEACAHLCSDQRRNPRSGDRWMWR